MKTTTTFIDLETTAAAAAADPADAQLVARIRAGAETAQLLDCTTANLKVRLHRARQALRTLLEPLAVTGVAVR